MPATLVSTTVDSSIFSGYSGSGLLPLPAGTQAGDLIVWAFSVQNINSSGPPSLTFPGTGSVVVQWGPGNGGENRFGVWAGVVTAAQITAGGLACSWNNSNGYSVKHVVSTWRGANIAVDGYSQNGGSGTQFPAFTTTRGKDETVLGFLFANSQAQGSSGNFFTPIPTGFTLIRGESGGYPPPGSIFKRDALSGPVGSQAATSSSPHNTYAASLSIYTNTAPDAPTWKDAGGTADGATVSRAVDTPLAWTPVDVDGDAQVGYDLRYRAFGTLGPWTTISRPTAGATAAGTIPAGTLCGRCAVQVRTYDAAGPGAWSADRLIVALDAVGIVSAVPTKLDPGMLLALAQVQRLLVPAVT